MYVCMYVCKTKACLNLKLIAGKEISSGEGSLLTNILHRNCTDKNKAVVRKILEVRKLQIIEEVHRNLGERPDLSSGK